MDEEQSALTKIQLIRDILGEICKEMVLISCEGLGYIEKILDTELDKVLITAKE